jgi:hypothetical protein
MDNCDLHSDSENVQMRWDVRHGKEMVELRSVRSQTGRRSSRVH